MATRIVINGKTLTTAQTAALLNKPNQMTKTTSQLLDELDNVNWTLSQMTIHAIHNTARGHKLQDRYDALRRAIAQARD